MLRLPPLNALKAFEAAARHLSFKQAAEELCVSQGAISRHILNLEDFLGLKLFERRHRHVKLTRDGASYLQAVHDALVGISNATQAVSSGKEQKMLKLKLPPTCAVRWLVPRLARFRARHPEVSVQVTTSHELADFDKDDIDAGVHYGVAVDPTLTGERLFSEVLIPVVSPTLAAKGGSLRSPEDLSEHLLLHSLQRPTDWQQWFEVAGVSNPCMDQSLILENSSLTYQGAVDGLGIAIAQLAFVIEELKSGRLVTPFDIRVNNRFAYHFVFRSERGRQPKIRWLHAWISHEAALMREMGRKYAL